MKLKKHDSRLNGRSIISGLLMVIVAAVTLEVTNIIQQYFSQQGIKEEASLRAMSEMDGARSDIMVITEQVETALRNSKWVAQWCLEQTDSIMRVPERLVEDNPIVTGSTLALVPGYNKKYPQLAPYCFRNAADGALKTISLATEDYDYPSHEWFTEPLKLQGGYWSEPYFDEGGGNILMTTYSLPVRDKDGVIAAILTADISLDWLEAIVVDMKTYEHSVNTIPSRAVTATSS